MQANHISRKATITLNDSPDKILPLFTAYGETLWITGWNPEYIYSEDGKAQKIQCGKPDIMKMTRKQSG